MPLSHLVPIYQRRLGRLAEGTDTLGATEFLRRVTDASGDTPVVAGLVRAGRHNFVLLVRSNDGTLVGCLGVDAGIGNPEFDWRAH